MVLSEIIKTYRTAHGMSQAELAKAAGYTDRSAIAQIERGAMGIPSSKLKTFARLLDIPMDLLLGEEHINSPVTQRLPEDLVIAFSASGLTITPGFNPGELDFNDLVDRPLPDEIYNVVDPHEVSLARFTGDELRSLPPDPTAVRSAYNERSISGTTVKAAVYKMIDRLPEDKQPILKAYLSGMLGL